MPQVPEIRTDGSGRPKFAAWESIDCYATELDNVATCAEGIGCTDSVCLQGSPGSPGVCSEIDVDTSCDGGLEGMGWSDGLCWACVPPLVHTKACCLFADQGFDCRDWPFPGDGPFGSICARHEDCELGLICGPHLGSDFGICQCPGLNVQTIAPAGGCF